MVIDYEKILTDINYNYLKNLKECNYDSDNEKIVRNTNAHGETIGGVQENK